MAPVLLFLLLTVLVFGAGFAVDVLWIVAAVMLALWVIGFVARSAEGSWYRW